MRIVFMGTPIFAANILLELANHHEVVAVYTKKDAIRGRGNSLVETPVSVVAQRCGIDVFTPESLKDSEVIEQIQSFNPDFICVAAYGMILPKEILDIPIFDCLNVHASLLPRWRGAAPIERALLEGDSETGVCIMRMEEDLDTGCYCISRSMEIGSLTASELEVELSDLGARALLSAIIHIEHGSVAWFCQDESLCTYAKKIAKHELFLKRSDSFVQLVRKVNAQSSAHPCKCIIANKPSRILKARIVDSTSVIASELEKLNLGPIDQTEEAASSDGDAKALPFAVYFYSKRLFLAATDGFVEIITIQPDGKSEMSALQFASGIQDIKDGLHTWEEYSIDQ